MSTTTTTPIRAEFRTPTRIQADEEIAAEAEMYLVKDGATGRVVLEASDERRRLAEESTGPNNAIADGGLNVPFLWNGRVHRVTRAEHRDGQTLLAVAPPDASFEAEVRRRIEGAPHRVLTFYQGFGFVCFPEDFTRYQG